MKTYPEVYNIEARQDLVDIQIQRFIENFLGTQLEWNIENIGIIRDALETVVVDNLHRMTAAEFYPAFPDD